MYGISDAILFCTKKEYLKDSFDHLNNPKYDELYFEVKFPIKKTQFSSFPIYGYIHVKGNEVKARVIIQDIISFSKDHYEKPGLARKVKPKRWIDEWNNDTNNIRGNKWKNALIITKIETFEYNTKNLERYDGKSNVKIAPRGFVRIIPPAEQSASVKRKPIEQERKIQIEKAAINAVIEYFIQQGYETKSVEKDNVGYDLQATKGEEELYIEVKGSAESDIGNVTGGFTPNEYKVSKNDCDKYRICIIADALFNPIVYEFNWHRKQGTWNNKKHSLKLKLQERIAANFSVE